MQITPDRKLSKTLAFRIDEQLWGQIGAVARTYNTTMGSLARQILEQTVPQLASALQEKPQTKPEQKPKPAVPEGETCPECGTSGVRHHGKAGRECTTCGYRWTSDAGGLSKAE